MGEKKIPSHLPLWMQQMLWKSPDKVCLAPDSGVQRVAAPQFPGAAPRDCICKCNFGISMYLFYSHADIWYRELVLFPGPPMREGTLWAAAQAICNLPTGQWPRAAASSISSWLQHFLTCISLSRDYKQGAASPFSLQHSFLDPEWGYSPERRHSSAEFAVMAERGTRWSAAVTKGMNLNPIPNYRVKPELGISRSAPGRGPTGLHLTEGLLLRPLKSSLCLQQLQIKPKRRHHFCRQ